MSILKDGDISAFPIPLDRRDDGMTLRDYFAASALSQCIFPPATDDEVNLLFGKGTSIKSNAEIAAARAYWVADAMLERRKRP